MVLWVYNVLLVLAFPAILAVLLSKARSRPGLPARLGWQLPPERGATALGNRAIWIHAVSLGEVVAVAPLVKALHRQDPSRSIVVSTVTETGREAVLDRLAGVATHCYAPLDYRGIVRRYVRRVRPAVYVFVETELWPNLLSVMRAEGVPTILVNGRISSRSFARQQWPIVRTVYREVLTRISLCLMQSTRDAARVVALGAPADRVRTTGNIKFDQPLPSVPAAQLDPIRRWVTRAPQAVVVVAGSTHPGEETKVLEACASVRKAGHPVRVVMAPRHIERASELAQLLATHGIPFVRRSQLAAAGPADEDAWVLLLDTRGELGAVYQFATVAFVGGTLVPLGGHNLLEPAAWGKPVVYGPHTDHCQESARALEAAGGGVRVADAAALARQVIRWCEDEAARTIAGQAAQGAVRENQGALEQCRVAIESVLAGLPSAAGPR